MPTYYLKQHRTRPIAAASVIPESTGWSDVTPAAWNNDPDFPVANGNYGWNGALVDPTNPARLYAFTNYQGVWVSNDYGKTWAKISTTAALDLGRCWTCGIAPDATYIITTQGFGPTMGTWRSTDGGITYTSIVPSGHADVSGIFTHATDAARVLLTMHDSGDMLESVDGGLTYTNQGQIGTTGNNPKLCYIDTDTLLCVSDGDNGAGEGTFRGVRSGSVWPWTWTWTHVDTQQHWHGGWQGVVDGVNIYAPGAFGMRRSTDSGLTFAEVSSEAGAAAIMTPTTIYCGNSYATLDTFPPRLQHALRASGTSWTTDTAPAWMVNGPCQWARTVNPAGQQILIAACWRAGLGRLVI